MSLGGGFSDWSDDCKNDDYSTPVSRPIVAVKNSIDEAVGHINYVLTYMAEFRGNAEPEEIKNRLRLAKYALDST